MDGLTVWFKDPMLGYAKLPDDVMQHFLAYEQITTISDTVRRMQHINKLTFKKSGVTRYMIWRFNF